MWQLLDTRLADKALAIVKAQFDEDIKSEKPSLLAKWLPSANTSSKESRRLARIICAGLGLTEIEYRKTLSGLREKLDIVERKMTSGRWAEIDYESVPSNANMVYRKAFFLHDKDRRENYLNDLKSGVAKINAGVLFPPQIVQGYYSNFSEPDDSIEALWNALPDTVEGEDNAIVVADGSGSMSSCIGNSNVTALAVANSLAIYFAERASGVFKDRYITFSSRPKLVDLSKGKNLYEKLVIASSHCEVANTNIEAVFTLILDTAKKGRMKQDELPKSIIVISDMEFDECCENSRGIKANERLVESVGEKYSRAGYSLPRLVFWNVNSRTGTIPVKENKLGVALVSGFSAMIMKLALSSSKLDPYDLLVDALSNERYSAVEAALKEAGVVLA
jgi:hypothetical protein